MISFTSIAQQFIASRFSFLRAALPLAALALLTSTGALAQKSSSVASGPVVISGGTVTATYVLDRPGAYVLSGNRIMSDATKAIVEITAPDVTLDLGGFSLSYSGSTSGRFGINIPATENAEVRNGTIANADIGLFGQVGKGLRVIDVRFVSCTTCGLFTQNVSTLVDRCHVIDGTGYGLYTTGSGTLLIDCVVSTSGAGVTVRNGSRVVRTTVLGGTVGFDLGSYSTAADCTVSGTTLGGVLAGNAVTLRNVDATNNVFGVRCSGSSLPVIMGSRITTNTTNIQGSYTSGGSNVIQ